MEDKTALVQSTTPGSVGPRNVLKTASGTHGVTGTCVKRRAAITRRIVNAESCTLQVLAGDPVKVNIWRRSPVISLNVQKIASGVLGVTLQAALQLVQEVTKQDLVSILMRRRREVWTALATSLRCGRAIQITVQWIANGRIGRSGMAAPNHAEMAPNFVSAQL